MPSWDVHFDVRVRTEDPEVLRLTARVEALASVIRGIPIPPHVQQRLDGLNIIRAVRGTTGIEGTEFSEEEVAEILSSPPGSPDEASNREEQEVRNSEALMLGVAERLKRSPRAPLTEGLIHSFHATLTRNIDYEHNEPGRYRTYRVTVGRYVPPETGAAVRKLMAEFIEWFNTGPPARWSPVVRAIVAPLLRRQHPPVWGWERANLARRGELPVISGRNQRTGILFPCQLLLPAQARVCAPSAPCAISEHR